MKKILFVFIFIVAVFAIFFIFIPAFQGRLIINPIIQIGPVGIHWYGIILAAAIFIGYFFARRISWKFGISKQDVDDFSFWLIVIGVLGARAYFVLFNWQFFSGHLPEIYQLWHGGLSIYGGIIAGIIFTYFYTRKKAYTFWQLADLLALALPLAQAVGRFGNFVNQEAFGVPTNLFWKLYISPAFRPAEYANNSFFHPTFLYEATADILIFLLLLRLVGKFKPGMIALAYLVAYSLIRFFIESLRVDSLFVYGIRADQLIAFLIIISSGILIFQKVANLRKN